MAWTVLEPYVLDFNGKPHRFLEIEADTEDEITALLEKSLTKGWDLYVRGRRTEAPFRHAVMLRKPEQPD
jgi:hypothetical protein